jgi:hypothetical protein
MPEADAAYVATFRSDESRPQLLASFHRGPVNRINDYLNKSSGLYRPLMPGEIEISSTGQAQAFYTRRAKFEHRAGTIMRWGDQDRLISGDRAPIHTKQLFNHSSDDIVDEYRLGIVSRPKDAWQVSYPTYNGFYAAEEYLSLKNPIGVLPEILYSRQHGHVLNKAGDPIKQTSTKLPLRSKQNYYAPDDSATTYEIDELGNVYIETSDAALQGYELKVSSGSYKRSVQLNEDVVVSGNRSDSVGINSVCQVQNNYQLSVGAGTVFNMIAAQDLIDFETASGNSFNMSPADGIILNELTGNKLTMAKGSVKLNSVLAHLELGKTGLIKLGNESDDLLKLLSEIINSFIQATYVGFGFPGSNVAELANFSSRLILLGG